MRFNTRHDMPGEYFPVPKVIFRLGLEPNEILIYTYLMFCEDREKYQCYPSYTTIGDAVGLSKNTVRKYVESLERKGFIYTEHTTVMTKDGRIHNGSLRYTIQPLRPIEDAHFEKQLREAQKRLNMQAALKRLEEYDRMRGRKNA